MYTKTNKFLRSRCRQLLVLMVATLSLTMTACDDENTPRGGEKASFEISAQKVEVIINQSQNLVLTPGDGDYEVSSKDEKIATAAITDGVLVITGIEQGETTISVQKKGDPAPALVRVTVVSSPLSLSTYAADVKTGEQTNVTFVFGSQVKNKKISYTISDGTIVEVELSETGAVITGKKAGTSTITFELEEGKYTSVLQVSVASEYPIDVAEKDNKLSGRWRNQYIPENGVVILPEGIIAIPHNFFLDGTNLKELRLPSTLKELGAASLSKTSLTEITIPDGVTQIALNTFKSSEKLEKVTLGKNTIKIGLQAFNYCSSLKSITLPETVEEIANYAFQGCTSLESVALPKSLKKLGRRVFSDCPKLKEMTISSENKFFTITEGLLCDKEVTTLYLGLVSPDAVQLIIPATITLVEEEALSSIPESTTIKVCAKTPPELANYDELMYITTLLVPKGTLEAYKGSSWYHDGMNISEYAE